MSAALAWCGDPAAAAAGGGRWGSPDALSLPLDDRGLLLADGLFETVLVEAGQPHLLAAHLERWCRSADLLALAPPPDAAVVRALLAEALRRSGWADAVLRLNWSRGGGGRGIDLPGPGDPPAAPRFWLQLSPWQPRFTPVRVMLSRWESRNAASLVSRCKTFAYGGAIQARREARIAGADDALLSSSAGGLCCGTVANLLLRISGRWLTPPLASGCLPGVMRGQALALGLAEEAALEAKDLEAAEGALLINSLGCRPIVTFEGRPLPHPTPAQAEHLWRRLLAEGSPGPEAAPCPPP
jgi:branched-subunit amino acid aminotransferase/4-amino-4-deoxychorismate lyase